MKIEPKKAERHFNMEYFEARRIWHYGVPLAEPEIDDPDEHPEDQDQRRRSSAMARQYIHAFLSEHPELACSILLYRDDQAHELLDSLRDEFWGSYVP